MSPEVEIPRVFDCWSYWLAEAGLCGDIKEVDLLEMQVRTLNASPRGRLEASSKPGGLNLQVFGCQPKVSFTVGLALNCATQFSVLTESPYQRPEFGPGFGPIM